SQEGPVRPARRLARSRGGAPMRRRLALVPALLAAALAGTVGSARQQQPPPAPQVPNQAPNQAAQARAAAPTAVPDPVPFATKDGKVKGWKVTIPGNRALATPAVVGGRVFLG